MPSTVRTLAFNKPNLKWCVGRFLVDTLLKLGVAAKNIFVLDVGKKYDLGAIEVEPVELHHDVENFGYKIIFKKDNYKVIYCVDTSSMDGIEAKNYDLYLIEANYSDEELEQRIEKQIENAEFVVGMRVANTHLSQGQWADFIMSNAKDTSEAVMIHQHKEKGEK